MPAGAGALQERDWHRPTKSWPGSVFARPGAVEGRHGNSPDGDTTANIGVYHTGPLFSTHAPWTKRSRNQAACTRRRSARASLPRTGGSRSHDPFPRFAPSPGCGGRLQPRSGGRHLPAHGVRPGRRELVPPGSQAHGDCRDQPGPRRDLERARRRRGQRAGRQSGRCRNRLQLRSYRLPRLHRRRPLRQGAPEPPVCRNALSRRLADSRARRLRHRVVRRPPGPQHQPRQGPLVRL